MLQRIRTPLLQSTIFDENTSRLASYNQLLSQKTAQQCVVHALLHLLDQAGTDGVRPESYDCVIDCGTSSSSIGIGYCPTLTSTRCRDRGYYSINHNRRLTLSEMMRLQGYPPEAVTIVPPETKFGAAVGNAFSAPVVARILRAAVAAE